MFPSLFKVLFWEDVSNRVLLSALPLSSVKFAPSVLFHYPSFLCCFSSTHTHTLNLSLRSSDALACDGGQRPLAFPVMSRLSH